MVAPPQGFQSYFRDSVGNIPVNGRYNLLETELNLLLCSRQSSDANPFQFRDSRRRQERTPRCKSLKNQVHGIPGFPLPRFIEC
jgi:hypothetical protein